MSIRPTLARAFVDAFYDEGGKDVLLTLLSRRCCRVLSGRTSLIPFDASAVIASSDFDTALFIGWVMNLVRALLARLYSVFRSPPLPPPPRAISRTDDQDMWRAYADVACTRNGSTFVPKVACTPQWGSATVLAKPGWLPPHVRVFERRRRKHGKFVTPNGPAVVPRKRPRTQEIEPKLPPKPVVEVPTTTDLFIVDTHHEDTEKVLYTGREHDGEFTFRDTILQQLDRYFFYLGHMKKSDPDAYALYSKVGRGTCSTSPPVPITGLGGQVRSDRADAVADLVQRGPSGFRLHRLRSRSGDREVRA